MMCFPRMVSTMDRINERLSYCKAAKVAPLTRNNISKEYLRRGVNLYPHLPEKYAPGFSTFSDGPAQRATTTLRPTTTSSSSHFDINMNQCQMLSLIPLHQEEKSTDSPTACHRFANTDFVSSSKTSCSVYQARGGQLPSSRGSFGSHVVDTGALSKAAPGNAFSARSRFATWGSDPFVEICVVCSWNVILQLDTNLEPDLFVP